MKTPKELINSRCVESRIEGPVRITLTGVLPLDPSKPMTVEERQALQTSVEDEYLKANPGAKLVRTEIPKRDSRHDWMVDAIAKQMESSVRGARSRLGDSQGSDD